MRKLFLQVMHQWEPYFQESFQLHADKADNSDHTFKFAAMIKAPSNRAGQTYSTNYDSLSNHGMVNINMFTHTKANDELRPHFKSYRKSRENAGAPPLMRVEGDGGGDRSLWPEIFPELNDNVKPWKRIKYGCLATSSRAGLLDTSREHGLLTI